MYGAIIYFVVTLILTIALAPRPPTPKAAAITDFQLPTADQGRNIPVIFGTCDISGSNCVWYGDVDAAPIRQHSLFTTTTTGYQYYIGFHLVLGHGSFDSMNIIRWDQKISWQGKPDIHGAINPITTNSTACMNWPSLFGGRIGGQGGLIGCFNVHFGGTGEVADSYLASQLGSVPAFKGVTSVVWVVGRLTDVFTNSDFSCTTSIQDCGYIGITPYLKGVAFNVTRITQGWNIPGGCWYPGKAVITNQQILSTPPTFSPTFEAATFGTVNPTDTTMTWDIANQQNIANFSATTIGFINIGAEWIKVTGQQTTTSAGNTTLTGVMNIQRGQFGTTPGTYPLNTLYYFYVLDVNATNCMNAAHIVYQCLTDPIWGMGLSTAQMDDTQFKAAADQFFTENMGLCMQWINASTVEDFLKIVLNHCAANLTLDNFTGLYQLVPIRGGYDVSTLPTYDESTIKSMDEFSTQGWADEVNEVVLVYTDPSTGLDTAITGQDISNIDVQGKIVSTQVNYQGIRDHLLAADVLGRELSARTTPLIKLSFTVNRSAWATTLGGLFKINWAARGVTGLVCRVSGMDKGKLEDNTISIQAVQDIYALGLYNYQIATWAPPAASSIVPAPPPRDTGPTVISSTQTAPPTAPQDGDKYLVPPGATGAWAGEAGQVAIWDATTSTWVFVSIPTGALVFDQSTGNYLTADIAGNVGNSGLSGTIKAVDVVYDDSTSNLGVDNVQAAIDILAANSAGSINLVAYSAATALWYATSFDGTVFATSDGISYVTQNTTGQTSFNDLIWVQSLNKWFALDGAQVGHPTTTGIGNLFGNWTYVTVGPPPSGLWTGLRWIPQIGLLVVFNDNAIQVSSDGTTWSNPFTGTTYAAAVTADTPVSWYRLGEGATIYTDSGSIGDQATFAPASGGIPGSGFSVYSPVITGGSAVAFKAMTYVEPRTSSNGPVQLITGTSAFTIELWIQKYMTAPPLGMMLYSQNHLNLVSGYANTLAFSCFSADSFKLRLQTRTFDPSTGIYTTGTNLLATTATNLWDGAPHHVVVTSTGTGTVVMYVDNVVVGSGTGLTVDNILNDSLNAGSIFGTDFQANASSGNSVVDELAVYHTALSSTRVGVHYNAGVAGLTSQFTIVDMLWDELLQEMLIFGHFGDLSGGSTPRFVPKVYSAPSSLATLAFVSNISPNPTTDNITVQAVAALPATGSIPSPHQNLGWINGFFPTLSLYFTQISAIVPFGGQFFVFGKTPSGTYTGLIFTSSWVFVSVIPHAGTIPTTWTSITKVVLSGTNVFISFPITGPFFAVQTLDLTIPQYVAEATPFPFFAVTTAGGVLAGEKSGFSGSFEVYNSLFTTATNVSPPFTFTTPPVGWTGGVGFTDNGFVGAGTLNYYLQLTPNVSANGTNGFGWWLVSGASTVTTIVESPTGTTFIDLIFQGTYVYAITQAIVGGAINCIRYKESTMTLDGSFAPPVIANPSGGLTSWFYIEGTFMSVGGVYGFVVDLTTEASPVYYTGGFYGVAMNSSAHVALIRYSTNHGTSWSTATFTAPVQVPAHGIDCLVYDGAQFIASGEGWSAISNILSASWTFSGGTSGIPATYQFIALYPNNLGSTGGALGIVGSGASGSAFTGATVGTTNGLVWSLGPKIKASASQVSFNPTGSSLPAADVQTALVLLGGAWDTIRHEIFGS